MSVIIGYARTSTAEQSAGLIAQQHDLAAAGADPQRIYAEQVSSVAERPGLAEALRSLRRGDVLMVTKPDRLARNTAELLAIVQRLDAQGVSLVVLSMGGQRLDTSSATGRLMLTLLGGVAEFERALMLERQREGIAKAKADGRYRGRAPTARAQAGAVRTLKAEGMRPTDIAIRLGISRKSVYRCLEVAA